jgi:hypothetical protein
VRVTSGGPQLHEEIDFSCAFFANAFPAIIFSPGGNARTVSSVRRT